jgi:hypothetical protein
VADTGQVPVVTDAERQAAAADAAFWRARCFVLAEQRHTAALLSTMEQLFGLPLRVADVYVWRVG